MPLLFTGFNAFGQHECISRDVDCAAGFSEINAPVSTQNQCTISIGFRYAALAFGRKLWLRGLLDDGPNECVTLKAAGDIKALAAGDSHCLVLLESGQLYRVQPKLQAELLVVRLEAPPRSNSGTKRSFFGAPKAPSSPIIEHIACGSHINVAVSSENAVFSIPSCLHQFAERQFRVKQLQCGHEHAVLLNVNGDVFTWGNGLRGQLGQPVLKVEETPQLMEALAGIKITQIAAGGWHSAAISAFGDLYTWGLNCSGQLGMRVMKPGGFLKEPTVYPLPQLQDLPECGCSKEAKSNEHDDDDCAPLRVFAGSRHTLLTRRCGRLWASGWCQHGQLGTQLQNRSYMDAFQALDGIRLNTCSDDVLCGPWSTLLSLKGSGN
ncbi:RCC1 domain-containing protein 1 isoform X1 [Drosophila rhopaloa]|uniref:RCC1 domain-containing protein 1 n=1 Tax=Drosophila rhopaloa TaxID=1041015 RepID=A0ABM5I6T9_DRORH|nr:RCC1 domain-containing protein 1 isoform X1 [Drosophila rhopaloa]XP_016991044.2 RCC1 domain-containing protein 1 isoform X1 [Drosophila rhopaloa]